VMDELLAGAIDRLVRRVDPLPGRRKHPQPI
jgi:hypothetical protein